MERVVEEFKDWIITDGQPQEAREFCRALIANYNPWVLCTFYKNEFMGVGYFNEWTGSVEKPHGANFHVFVRRKFWGEHLHSVYDFMLEYMFNTMGLQRIEVVIPEKNLAKRAIKKLGFVEEGRLRDVARKNGQPVNYILYGLLKGEYYGRT